MKRGTPRHPKMFALAEELKITLPHAVGILEMLWHFAAESCPRGDIGSIPDKEIAKAVGWTRRASSLIEALCSERCRWIDRSLDHRLIIHDWPDHAENDVQRRLAAIGKEFLPCYDKTSKPFGRFDDGFVEPKEDIPSSREATDKATASGVSSWGSAEGGARLDWPDFLPRWNRHRGFRKPPKPQRDTAEQRWARVDLTTEQCDAALDGYYESDWGRKNNYPILGFVKDPDSWIITPPTVYEIPAVQPAPPFPPLALALTWRSDVEFQSYLAGAAIHGARIEPDDCEKAYRIFVGLTPEQRLKSTEDYAYLAKIASGPGFIKTPVKHLQGRPWDVFRIPVAPKRELSKAQIGNMGLSAKLAERAARRAAGEIL